MNALRKVLLSLAAPALAFVVASIVATVVLLLSGDSVSGFWSTILTWPQNRNLVNIINNASVLYLSGVAAAIGFRMNLFNIGVEGQYRVGVFAAAVFAGQAWLPGWLNTFVAILVAMLAAAIWAAIPGLLKVTRGVSEVISTIMLNAIAGAMVGYFLRRVGQSQGNAINTKQIPEESWVGGFSIFPDTPNEVYGLAVLAIVVGVAFSVVLNRTRFGFNLRATGQSQSAAIASGVNAKRMVVAAMVLSGAVAGLIGLPALLGVSYAYGSTFQTGIGFAGIAVALLGRNHPVGIAFGALVFAFLTEQSNLLDILAGVDPDIVAVTQGVIVLSVVIAYEAVRRYRITQEQRSTAGQTAAAPSEGVTA